MRRLSSQISSWFVPGLEIFAPQERTPDDPSRRPDDDANPNLAFRAFHRLLRVVEIRVHRALRRVGFPQRRSRLVEFLLGLLELGADAVAFRRRAGEGTHRVVVRQRESLVRVSRSFRRVVRASFRSARASASASAAAAAAPPPPPPPAPARSLASSVESRPSPSPPRRARNRAWSASARAASAAASAADTGGAVSAAAEDASAALLRLRRLRLRLARVAEASFSRSASSSAVFAALDASSAAAARRFAAATASAAARRASSRSAAAVSRSSPRRLLRLGFPTRVLRNVFRVAKRARDAFRVRRASSRSLDRAKRLGIRRGVRGGAFGGFGRSRSRRRPPTRRRLRPSPCSLLVRSSASFPSSSPPSSPPRAPS